MKRETMNLEQSQQLKQHINAIAQLLHADAQEKGMTLSSLGEIEQTVRSQLQQYVCPQLGIFLSTKAPPQTQERDEK
jgi:hypothetical protein